MTSQQLSVKVAINSWRLVAERAGKTFSNFTEDELFKEVAPGKNRVIYIWGHLIATHDAMFSILGLEPRLHPELDAIFISNPDETVAQLPSAGELKKYWDEVNRTTLAVCRVFRRRMVAAAPCDVRRGLRQRSNPEPTGCSPESNQPRVLPFGASDSGPRMTGLFGTSNMLA